MELTGVSCGSVEQTWPEPELSGLDKDPWQDKGLDGDRTSGWGSKTGVILLGLDIGTLGVITLSETRHGLEGKSDAVVVATCRDDVHNADAEALRDSVCSPTNTLLNWYTCLQSNHSFTLELNK